MELIKNILTEFSKVSLLDLENVRLMNRIDKKFCLHISQLPSLLDAIRDNYSTLEIEGKSIFKYDNTYFDTTDNHMFLCHQNGKQNRYKIRLRKYIQSDDNFLEVKFKSNKGRTIKERIARQSFEPDFSSDEFHFIKEVSPYSGHQIEPKIRSYFNRFTLVNHQFTERVTVDLFPGFKNQSKEITLNNLVIIEIKQSKSSNPALISKALQQKKIKPQGFSKYCVGRALLEDNIKKNNFKPLLLKIKKENYY
jgi:hypothetical protein